MTIFRRSMIVCCGVIIGVFAHRSASAADLNGNIWITSNTTLSGDVNGSVEFKASGITLDCAGHYIKYVNVYDSPARCADRNDVLRSCAISSSGRSNITVKNCNVWAPSGTGFFFGIWVSGTSTATANNVTIANSSTGWMYDTGVYLRYADSAYVDHVQSDFNGIDGIHLEGVSNSAINFALISSNGDAGITEYSGYGNEFQESELSFNSSYGFYSLNSTLSYLYSNDWMSGIWYNAVGGIRFDHGTGFLVDADNVAQHSQYGISVQAGSKGGVVRWSTATTNSTCDAFQTKDSTNISWVHNTFTKRCNVPAQ